MGPVVRILCPAERRLAPPRPCLTCGELFQPNMKAVWSGKGVCCSIRCRSLYASRKSKESFTSPPATVTQRRRAHATVNGGKRRGTLTPPAACPKCGKLAKLAGHHFDYGQPGTVYFLCNSCHQKAHRDPQFLSGL